MSVAQDFLHSCGVFSCNMQAYSTIIGTAHRFNQQINSMETAIPQFLVNEVLNISTPTQVDTTMKIYNPVVADSSNHQPSPTFSRLDEIYQISVDDIAHQRPFVALSSLPDVFPGPQTQTRVEVPDARSAVLVDFIADGSQRNRRFDSDTLQTDIVANSSDNERYKTEDTQIPMTPFGAKPLPDGSYPPTSFKNSTSGSTRLRMRSQEAIRVSTTHNKGEYLADPDLVSSALAPPSQLCMPRDRGMRVEKMVKGQYQCRSCWVIFAQRQGLSRHRKDKHEPKNRCDFCTDFTWSKGRHYIYRRYLQEEHRDVVLSTVTSNTWVLCHIVQMMLEVATLPVQCISFTRLWPSGPRKATKVLTKLDSWLMATQLVRDLSLYLGTTHECVEGVHREHETSMKKTDRL
ncbi:hypothetical protein EDB83DRAFT_2584748 [Lactarius deliciosus]|nr:hypothetical protein EDB83DRAFT_2584748 [Lactarius deliciosus]